MPTIEERFSVALHHSARTWRQALDARLKDLGVGSAGWLAIALVAKAPSPLSQKELANQLGVEGPTVVATADRLESAGLIVRTPSDSDRRVKLIVLTGAGRALYARVRAEADAFRHTMLSDVDKKALATATAVLEALRARIEAEL
jgi:MarR family transcriptional regulator, transcriptional regulator for hemolysin